MNRYLTACLVLALAIVPAFADEWRALDQNARTEASMEMNILSSSADELQVEIVIPGYQEKSVWAGDKECVLFFIPGGGLEMDKAGYPMVPRLTRLVKVPHDCKVTMRVVSKEVVDVALPLPIVPSKGHFIREIDPANVPYEFGPVYSQDVFWPAEADQFQIGSKFQLRDNCGIRLQVLPLSANHVQKTMKVVRKAVISFQFEHGNRVMASSEPTAPGRTFRRIYQDAFLNYEEAPQGMYRAAAPMPDAENRKVVLVTPAQYRKHAGQWIAWKNRSGYQVETVEVNSGMTADDIKAKLQGLYDKTATRFGYVVLVGDAAYNSNFKVCQPMPTFAGKKEGAAADRVYVRLAGNDNYPDAFISRISGNNDDEISVQFNKIVAYEQNPPAGAWFTQGTCIASNQGSPADYERAEWLQNGGGASQKVPVVNGGLIGYGYTHFDDIYDPNAYAADVARAVNAGRSIILYIGHGSATSWGTTGFSNSNIAQLTNGGMLPVIWSVACVNGRFVHTGACFAEAWLRHPNGGAVAVEAASTNESWVPPCDKQAAVANAIINRTHFTFGALEAVGCIKGLEVWGDADSTEGNKMAEQCNLFGDCTLLVRTKQPQAVAVSPVRAFSNQLAFDVTAEGRSVPEATVTVYSEDFSYSASAETDESGRATLALESNQPLFYTVVGPDLLPVVDRRLE